MKNVSILDKRDDSKVRVEMPLNKADFQNVVYSCGGLLLIRKFEMQHSRCCGTEKDKLIINASVRECSQCDVFFGDVVSYAHHMEKVHLTVFVHCGGTFTFPVLHFIVIWLIVMGGWNWPRGIMEGNMNYIPDLFFQGAELGPGLGWLSSALISISNVSSLIKSLCQFSLELESLSSKSLSEFEQCNMCHCCGLIIF